MEFRAGGCALLLGGIAASWVGLSALAAEPTRAYFGDLHLHTSYSFDAFVFGTTATPDDAYNFAEGAPVRHPSGAVYQLKKPLDFLAVTDHAEYLGLTRAMSDLSSPASKSPIARRYADPDGSGRAAAFQAWLSALEGISDRAILGDPNVLKTVGSDAWERIVEAANRNNEPGKFTAFIGYEFTSMPDGKNLHRNVIFRGDHAPQPFSAVDSANPEDLWAFLEAQRRRGIQALVIPHNPNVSDGAMFGFEDFNGKPFTADYARKRAFYERLVEVTQIKGQSETNPALSPNDEFAAFQIYDNYLTSKKKITKFAGSYARDALRAGLVMYESEGVNPYKFGLVGGSDSHTAIQPNYEWNNSGGHGIVDGTPEARLDCTYCQGADVRKFGTAGLTGVWAPRNTREAIFDALARREAFATTGPRILVRFFAGYGLAGIEPGKRDWVDAAYQGGVPMGGELAAAPGQAPQFLVWAQKDPDSANLDRIQIIKVWTKDGQSHERISDVAWSAKRVPDAKTGRIGSVGSTVDLATVTYRNTIGATMLSARWRDPEFDPKVNAAYYARVLEIPTPRWTDYDAKRLGRPMPTDLPTSQQERAFTSPIWYDVPPMP